VTRSSWGCCLPLPVAHIGGLARFSCLCFGGVVYVYWMHGGGRQRLQGLHGPAPGPSSVIMHMAPVASECGSVDTGNLDQRYFNREKCRIAYLGRRRVDRPTEPAYPPRGERRVQMLLPSLPLEGEERLRIHYPGYRAKDIEGTDRRPEVALTRLNCHIRSANQERCISVWQQG
jgi:hypothetical protein